MIALAGRTLQFLVFHALILLVDRVAPMPRSGVQPELERFLRENQALKAQVRALVMELKVHRGKRPRVSMATRAAQVFAYLLTRGDAAFQNYYLSASPTTLRRWAAKFRRGPWHRRNKGGRPPLAQALKDLIIQLKTATPTWGAKRIQDELRAMGIEVTQPTIQKVLRGAGFDPHDGHPMNLERFKATVKDAIWAVDFFFVRTARGVWLSVLLVIDLHTRELIEIKACDAWGPDPVWTIRAFADAIWRLGRQPGALVHDHGTHFLGMFERQLRVLEIERRRTPVALPFCNGICERAVKSVRLEMLNHVRVADLEELQWFLDEYRTYYNHHRPNQALDGLTPHGFAEGAPKADLIDLAEIRSRKLVKRSFAHGLLHTFDLVAEPAAAA